MQENVKKDTRDIMNKNKFENLQTELKNKTLGYIGAGFGLVASLAWNDAIKALIDFGFPVEKNSLIAKLIYAIVMTVVVVLMTMAAMSGLKKTPKN